MNRNKWNKGVHNIQEGTIVILRIQCSIYNIPHNTPSMQWPLGRVLKVHPGADGIIRAATVQTSSSILNCGVNVWSPYHVNQIQMSPDNH